MERQTKQVGNSENVDMTASLLSVEFAGEALLVSRYT